MRRVRCANGAAARRRSSVDHPWPLPSIIRNISGSSPSTAVRSLVAVSLLVAILAARVASAAEPGWYVGMGLGESRIYQVSACSKVSGTLDPGFSCAERTTDTATSIFGGYQFDRHWSAEAGYIDLGKFTASASGTESGVPTTGSASLKASAFSVGVTGILPVNGEFGLSGRIGIVRWRTDESTSLSALGVSTTQDQHKTGVSLHIGAGAQYDFTREVRGRAELVRYPGTNGRSQIDVLLFSIAYRLG